MKWEPPTQTRAPDNQFRQCKIYQLLLEQPVYQISGVESGLPIPSAIDLAPAGIDHDNKKSPVTRPPAMPEIK